jgi:hypothetical protein
MVAFFIKSLSFRTIRVLVNTARCKGAVSTEARRWVALLVTFLLITCVSEVREAVQIFLLLGLSLFDRNFRYQRYLAR